MFARSIGRKQDKLDLEQLFRKYGTGGGEGAAATNVAMHRDELRYALLCQTLGDVSLLTISPCVPPTERG